MSLLGPGTGRLPWARGPGPFRRWGPSGWPWMWRRGRNRANPRIIPAWGMSTLASRRGCRGRRRNGGGGRIRAKVGAAGRGEERKALPWVCGCVLRAS